ncbi:MAG TPA: hypothetical protein VJO13_11900 [Ktedonobacterales bacterium]|nr:hypothetical protein [Ktedonobacterales bacterium]
MAQQVIVHLSDDEYARLEAEALKNNTTIERVVHAQLLQGVVSAPTFDAQAIQTYLYQQGVVENIPSGESDTAEEESEVERLAHLLSGGKSATEMVIEDRGPF